MIPLPRYHALPVLALVSSTALVSPANAAGPSFDCARAGTPIERLICKDPQLSDLDERLEKTIKEKLAQDPGARAALLAAERQWLRSRDHACAAKAAAQSRAATACLMGAYRSRIEALSVAPAVSAALCEKIIASYEKLVAADPDIASRKSFYPESPLSVLAGTPESGVRLAPYVAETGKQPTPGNWALRKKPPLLLSAELRNTLDKSDFIDRLPGTGFYAASSIQGTMACYASTYFEVKNGRAETAKGPPSFNDDDGAGCGVSRHFGTVGATPAAFEEAYDYTPALTSSLTVAGWSHDRFGAACTISFRFAPRFSPKEAFNSWGQSCTAKNCDALRGAALGLVERVQADPSAAEKAQIARLTAAQRADFLAMEKAAHVMQPQKIGDPGDFLDTSPLALPLIVGTQLYLVRVGHFTIGWRNFSDWSVKLDARGGKAGKEIAAIAIGMTKGRLEAVAVK